MDKTLGDQFIPDDFILKVKTDYLNVPLKQHMSTNIQSVRSDSAALGSIDDPLFGKSKYSVAFNIIPAADTLDYGTEQVIKKCYLVAYISSTFVLDPSDKGVVQNISVHEMNRKIDTTTLYNNSISESDYNPDPISFGNPIYMGGDSIKVYLDNAYAQKLLSATAEEIEDRSLFVDRVKGLIIKAEEPKIGGRINYISPYSIRVYVEYQMTDSEQNLHQRDTSDYFLCNNLVLNVFETESERMISEEPQEYVYLQGFDGIKPYISAGDLYNMISEWAVENEFDMKKLAISRASLLLPYEYDVDNYQMENYPTTLYAGAIFESMTYFSQVTKVDTVYNFRCYDLIDDIYYEEIVKGLNDRSHLRYRLDIGSHLQKLLSKDPESFTELDDIWIFPYTYNSTYGVYYYEILRYYYAIFNGPKHETPPQLQLVYSIAP